MSTIDLRIRWAAVTFAVLTLTALLAACQNAPASGQNASQPTADSVTSAPISSSEPTTAPVTEQTSDAQITPASTSEATTEAIAYPDDWREMPVIPIVSDRAREVYQRGVEMGRDPGAFSIVGDCQNVSNYFLENFAHPEQYDLGPYPELQETIDHYYESFARPRAAVQPGFNVAAVLSPLWSNADICDTHESPLECEFRLNNPSIVLISMETWWYDRPASTYAGYLRQIVEYSMEQGVIPILATKADNLEEDNSINAAIVQVAQEYDMPLWNFWAAVQPLPGHGLTDDGFHLTYARPLFGDEEVMLSAWPVRNLTALQAIDAVWRGVSAE
jgi:hypothetical protein